MGFVDAERIETQVSSVHAKKREVGAVLGLVFGGLSTT